MHPSGATLLAFCDAELGPGRSRRIAAHLAACETCRGELRLIEREKDELSSVATAPASGTAPGLAEVLSAMNAWQCGKSSVAASDLKYRLRAQIEANFGSPAVPIVERSGIRPEEFLGRTNDILEAFLGPEAAEAMREDVLRGLDWAAARGEERR